MTDLPVLRSRQANGIERRSVQGPSDALVEKAKMMAAATSALPKEYANKPGACLMVLDWADRNDVSIFEAVAEVSMVYGKPVVSAKMQKRLAARAGYHTKVIRSDAEQATVAVIGPDGEQRGDFTYTIELAQGLGITTGKNWTNDTAWMLIKRATTRALELYGPDELVSIFADDDEPDLAALPPVETADAVPAPDEAPPPPADTSDSEAVEAEVLPPSLNDVLEAATAKGIKPAALKAQAVAMGYEINAINQVMDNVDALMDLADWIDQQ